MPLCDVIYEYLKNGPMTDDELQTKSGRPRPSVRRSRQLLVKQGKVKKHAGGKFNATWVRTDWQPTHEPVAPRGQEASQPVEETN